MKNYFNEDLLEAGIDEVARGCLAGPVFSAAVIWPKECELIENAPILKDSKKLSKRQRLICKDYIEENALDYSVSQSDNKLIDKINILNATYKTMHKAIDNLNIDVDFLLIDGNKFEPYMNNNSEIIPHLCIVKGDDKYTPICCASILAKVYHDEYIEKICDEEPELNIYDWKSNMCYGTQTHIEAIKKNGLTKYHRRTFGICKDYI